MNQKNQHTMHDTLGLIPSLEEAMDAILLDEFHEGTPSPAAKEAAWDLAVAIGWTRLANLALPDELNGTLKLPEALEAAQVLLVNLAEWSEDIKTLENQWDNCDDQFEYDELTCGTLERGMDARAAMIAIDEAVVLGLTKYPNKVQPLIDASIKAQWAFHSYDALMRREASFLACALDTNQIDNWRLALKGNPSLELPWFLDGTLEEEAKKTAKIADSLDPTPQQWAKLQKQLSPPSSYRISDWLPKAVGPSMAAADPQQETPKPTITLQWQSSDARYEAYLGLVDRYAEDAILQVSFVDVATGDLTADLTGQPVTLAGIESKIGQDSYANFRYQDLAAKPHADTVLTVNGVVWTRIAE